MKTVHHLSDDRYLIVYRQPSFAAAGSRVPLDTAAFRRGGYHIVDADLIGFGDCALPGEKPLSFGSRPAAEAFLQRCYKAWGLRPRRGESVPILA